MTSRAARNHGALTSKSSHKRASEKLWDNAGEGQARLKIFQQPGLLLQKRPPPPMHPT